MDYNTEDTALEEFFDGCAGLEEVWIEYDFKDRSKGFGFAKFKATSYAQEALDDMNGLKLDGRTLFIKFDRMGDKPFDKSYDKKYDKPYEKKGDYKEKRGDNNYY